MVLDKHMSFLKQPVWLRGPGGAPTEGVLAKERAK